jgi:hypothetical protein
METVEVDESKDRRWLLHDYDVRLAHIAMRDSSRFEHTYGLAQLQRQVETHFECGVPSAAQELL